MGTSGIIARSTRQIKATRERSSPEQLTHKARFLPGPAPHRDHGWLFLALSWPSAFGHKSRVKHACFRTWNKYPRARITATTLNVHFADGPSCDADFLTASQRVATRRPVPTGSACHCPG